MYPHPRPLKTNSHHSYDSSRSLIRDLDTFRYVALAVCTNVTSKNEAQLLNYVSRLRLERMLCTSLIYKDYPDNQVQDTIQRSTCSNSHLIDHFLPRPSFDSSSTFSSPMFSSSSFSSPASTMSTHSFYSPSSYRSTN